jgi:thymidylate kinase
MAATGMARALVRDGAPWPRAAAVARARLVFVYCDLPAELAATRIAGRDTALSSFDRMPAAAARRMLAEEEASLRALFQRAAQVPGARQMVVDASRPVSENAALIAAVIEAG